MLYWFSKIGLVASTASISSLGISPSVASAGNSVGERSLSSLHTLSRLTPFFWLRFTRPNSALRKSPRLPVRLAASAFCLSVRLIAVLRSFSRIGFISCSCSVSI